MPKVLVVDDDPLVRFTVLAVLEDGGFDVLEAGTAPEALSLLEGADDIAAIITAYSRVVSCQGSL